MNLRAPLERLDRAQQRFVPTAVAVAVVKKYGDDRAAALSALVTFYGFLALFPLLLLFFTIVGIILGPHSAAQRDLVDSALAQFPIVGDKLEENIHALSRANPFAFVVSVLGLAWGSFGITNSLQLASARIWGVPRHREPGFGPRMLRGLALLGILGTAVVLSSVLAGASTIGAAHFGGHSPILRVGVFIAACGLNVGAYLLALMLLAPHGVAVRRLLGGTVLGGVGWSVLQAFGGYLLGHQLARSSQIYGFFAIVLGIIFWLNLGAQLFLYSSELNVVQARRLWPRSFLEPAAPDPDEVGGLDPVTR
jgi:YihY family inner membrane protein